MTATLTQARNALAAQLAAQITGLRASGSVPGQVNPPQAIVMPAPGTFVAYESMDGQQNYMLRVTLLVGAADDPDAQSLMDSLLGEGSGSVNAAVMADPTLGQVVSFAVVTGASGYGLLTWGGLQYLGCHVLVTAGA